MSAIPLNYHTAYQWTGKDEAGEILVEGMPPMPIGSPNGSGRYCPEQLLVLAAEACLN